MKITFHTFRHWKATMEYHKTKDMKHVQWLLGHRHSNSTDIYVTLEKLLYQTVTSEFNTTVSRSIEDELKLINEGWELHRAVNETTTIYKKRK